MTSLIHTCFKQLICSVILMLAASAFAASDKVPVLIHISDAVKPGSLININGGGVGGAVVVAMKQSSGGALPLSPPPDALFPSIVQRDTRGNFVVVRFPEQKPAGIYNVWVKNSFGWSRPIRLNAPRAIFQSEYEAWKGQQIQIVGRNFLGTEFGLSSDTLVRLVLNTNTYLQTVNEKNPYCVKFTVGDLPLGIYHVEVSSDAGVHWSRPSREQTLRVVEQGSDPIGLGVAWANDFAWTEYDITQPPYNVPVSSGTDVTSKIQDAINRISAQYKGGRVKLRNGNYRITRLTLPENIVLEGESADKTQFIYIGSKENMFDLTDSSSKNGRIGVHRFSIRLSNDAQRPAEFFNFWCSSTANRFFIKNIDLEYRYDTYHDTKTSGRGHIAMIGGKERAVVQGNRFVGWMANVFIPALPYVQFKGNYLEYSNSMNHMGGFYSFFENNTIKGHNEYNTGKPDSGYWTQHGGLYAGSLFYAAHNLIENIGAAGNADGEGILAENPGANFNYGSVISATASSIDVNPLVPLFDPAPALPLKEVYVVINQGKGLGQWRRVTGISGSTIQTSPTWDIQPDSTSLWTLARPNHQNTVYKNTLRHCTTAISLWGNWIDGVVADNVTENSIGVIITANRKSPEQSKKTSKARGQAVARSGFGFFNRVVRNTFSGVYAEKDKEKPAGGIKLGTGRMDTAHGYREVILYAIEIRENRIGGDPVANRRKSSISYNCGGLYGIDVDKTGDLTNLIVEKNTLHSNEYGISFSTGLYGAALFGNTFQKLTKGETLIDKHAENIVSDVTTSK